MVADRLHRVPFKLHVLARLAAAAAAVTLVGCGGGGGGGGGDGGSGNPPVDTTATSCTVSAQKDWLRDDMQQRYYWNTQAPNPDPAPFASVLAYFNARLFRGDAVVPADRWSYITDTASYEQFFAEGRSFGYGLFINGNELTLPLRVRYTEAKSPAAAANLQRGDTLLSVNGRPAAELVARADFSALSPSREGETVVLEVEASNGSRRSVTLAATTHDLTPVPVATTLARAGSKPVGYLVLKDFITQAEAPLRSGLAQIRAAGATELILDLRYNGGGRVSTANVLASLIAGNTRNGQVFAELRFNAQQRAQNTLYRIESTDPGFDRVVVLTGPRTCSASELVVNGLKPFVDVTTVGGATCGKPFGFTPASNCGNTYSHVTFESFNANGAGRYYDGIPASCAATDTFTGTLGTVNEPMTARALSSLDGASCAAAGAAPTDKRAAQAARSGVWGVVREPGDTMPGMRAD
jgi:carboxyl-terminal processing protease